MGKVLGVDIGGTNLRMGIVNKDLEIEEIEVMSSSFLKEKDSYRELDRIIASFLREKNEEDIEAITIGVPAMVNKERSMIYLAPNLAGISNINLQAHLEEKLGIKTIVDRDVNYLLIQDIHKYNLDPEGNKNIAGFYIGTGLGNPIYINGKIYRGKNGVAGELAHIPMYGLDQKCPCGGIGCFEIKASGKALEKIWKTHFSDIKLEDIFTVYGDTDIIREFISILSIPIASEITILDPDYVLFSSGVISMKNFPKSHFISEVVSKVKHPFPANNLKYLFTDNAHENGVLGGAITWFKDL